MAFPAAAADGGNEESIDDYMSRLMNRIRGISGGSDDSAPTAKVAPRPPVEPALAEYGEMAPGDAEADPAAATSLPEYPAEPVQLVARSAPPELGVDLKAMRELANLTARARSIGMRKVDGAKRR